MGSVIRLLVFWLQLTFCRGSDCTGPFQNILGACLHIQSREMTWCDAQHYCSSKEGELVQGRNYLKIQGKHFHGKPFIFWIGLTDFLHERERKRNGWRWSNGAVDPPSSKLKWHNWEPNLASEDCVRQYSLTVWNHPCLGRHSAVCQPRSRPGSTERISVFQASTLSDRRSLAEKAEHGGCAKRIKNIAVILDCAVLCHYEQRDRCVSFYFNKARKECHIVLYTDATMHTGTSSGWKKFVMKK